MDTPLGLSYPVSRIPIFSAQSESRNHTEEAIKNFEHIYNSKYSKRPVPCSSLKIPALPGFFGI